MKKLIFILLSLMPVIGFAQGNTKQNQSDTYLLNTKFPSVYISFEKSDKRTPRYPGESNEGIWLRFHNNIKWNVTIKTLGANKEHGDYNVFYEIGLIGKNEQKDKGEIPIGYRMGHVSSVLTLKSGDSFLFSIPREHLAKDLFLEIEFSYDWEQNGTGGGGGYITHKALFFSSDLPK